MVYSEVMRGLHYMHTSIFVEKEGVRMNTIIPSQLALHLVVSFDKFLDEKLNTSSDKVLCMNINFVKMVSKYKLFKDAVTVYDSVTVEKMYKEYLPIFVHLGKHNYYNILLDQTEEYYNRIPYHVLQWIRENRFQKLYDGTDRFPNELSHWAIDALMELMNKNVKGLDFFNTIEAWQLYSQNGILALSS